jgi:hypothetical protein
MSKNQNVKRRLLNVLNAFYYSNVNLNIRFVFTVMHTVNFRNHIAWDVHYNYVPVFKPIVVNQIKEDRTICNIWTWFTEFFSPSQSEGECVICLCNVYKGRKMAQLKCNHIFHKACITKWSRVSLTKQCPLCRRSYSSV